ncbi:hypothetical protein ACL07V_07290 [Streptomyces sp. MB22_4]|uniref:hypothetical protein n=1 Tax=Streptomyces sp. MB22_4 TaxID=3383120 RepID=UPI00399F9C08
METRGFDREAPYRRLSDTDLWSAFLRNCAHLTDIAAAAARDLSPDTEIVWTGRTVTAPFFAEHMREELILHRWDLTGDDRTAVRALNEPWMTEHSVVSVGRPLLARGRSALALAPDERFVARLRTPGTDDVVLTADTTTAGIRLAAPEGPPRSRATPPPDCSSCGAAVPPTPPAGTARRARRPCAGRGPSSVATDRPRPGSS